ncbi:hypothetical protein DXG01_016942 [Tephrocybe rancida]|nr:hypothetical protein DXG01_016942 [Tephrocybe rancida]
MPLPKKRQSAIPSLGLSRSQSISVMCSRSVAGARNSLPAQAQAFAKSQAVPRTPSLPNAMRVPVKPLVAGNGSPASKLPGTSTPKGTPPRMSNSTSGNTNTTNTTGSGSNVFGCTPSKIKAKVTPTKTNTPTKTKTPSKIRATPSKESLPGVSWFQQGLLDELLVLTMGNGVGNGEVAFSAWGETDDMEMLTDVGQGEVDEEPTSAPSTPAKYYTTNASSSAPKPPPPPDSTLSKPKCASCASNSTSSNTNTMNTTATGSSVFGGTPSKIKAKATPTKTNTPTKTKTPSKISATPSKESLPGVPWSQQGLLDEPLALAMGNGVGNGEVAFSVWGETDDMDLEMLTDVGKDEIDEEMSASLAHISALHARKILHYKRLLERAQASTATQLHALQAEVRVLRSSSSHPSHHLALTSVANDSDRYVCDGRRREDIGWGTAMRMRMRMRMERRKGREGEGEYGKRLVRALKGKGNEFSERDVRRALRGLGMDGRTRLIAIILDCRPYVPL